MPHNFAVSLAKDLVKIDTVNPPGNETDVVRLLRPVLEQAGFEVREFKYGENRSSIIAHHGRMDRPSVILSGHLDTVPLGSQPWSLPPFGAEQREGKIYGRGSADMKSGVAVIVATAIEIVSGPFNVPVTLVLSADEEIGCGGVQKLLAEKVIPEALCVLVAEPTGNSPCLGHKGVLWLKALFHGKTAHAAFPELGDNALIKAVSGVVVLNKTLVRGETHPVMGDLTMVASRFLSGNNYNSVPDLAEVGIDIRSTVNLTHDRIIKNVETILGPAKAEIEVIFDLPSLWTDPDNAISREVINCCDHVRGEKHAPRIATFYTDGGVLGPGLGEVPVFILGPGESGMAHQVDEHVLVSDIFEGVDIYLEILSRLCR